MGVLLQNDVPEGYVIGMGRNPGEEYGVSHLYKVERRPDPENPGMTEETYSPMCGYGWNRSDGERFSILRGHMASKGVCRVCMRRAHQHAEPIRDGWPHKTKWL